MATENEIGGVGSWDGGTESTSWFRVLVWNSAIDLRLVNGDGCTVT